MTTTGRTRSHGVAVCGAVFCVLLSASAGWSQVRQVRGAGPIRERPPGELATILRRDPDFSTIRFLGMQRSYRDELRAKLMVGHAAIRLGRPVAPMQPIIWPPEPRE